MLEFTRVPAPESAPTVPGAADLDILPFLRFTDQAGTGCRCSNCRRLIHPGDKLIWVPDMVQITDSLADIQEVCRQQAFNGSSSGWCLSCARKLGKSRRQLNVATEELPMPKWTGFGLAMVALIVFAVVIATLAVPR
jgi:hypothetical protein